MYQNAYEFMAGSHVWLILIEQSDAVHAPVCSGHKDAGMGSLRAPFSTQIMQECANAVAAPVTGLT